ncbi:MAG: LacI family DNA-binding transcriptional regulator [Anaerolineales bacterium]|nr:LacI family DNA-binding transcriptional regulator [Anaerolineales bacterium]MCB9127683.1 LacI family DNA-binding transcriptional regulator [Ardenticatenales bacterium]
MPKRATPSTIHDVAKAAGVSVATVSRVLNRPHRVRESTRRHVQAVIHSLNYRPNETARNLSTGRTLSISVAMPFMARDSFVERLRGIEATSSVNAYDLVMSNIESVVRRNSYYESLFDGRRFDGVVIATLRPSDEEAAQLANGAMPVVLLDTSHPLLSSVDCDDVEGGRLAAHHLIERGHRRLAFLGDTEFGFNFVSARERLSGFVEVLNDAGLALGSRDEWWIVHSSHAARTLLSPILDRPAAERPTAIFATSDLTALALLDGMERLGLKAPDDLAVIGYDDLHGARWKALTTIRQPLFQSGVSAIELLLSQMGGGNTSPQQTLLPLELIIREST